MFKKLFIVMVSILCLCGCSSKLDRVIESGNYIVVDVRTSDEYNSGHVKGAINIPYDEIDSNISLDKDMTILVYCRSGRRSEIAYSVLNDMGYDVIDLGSYESVTLDKE